MSAIVVSDTTSLIVLEKLDALDLFGTLFQQVLIPEVVLQEMQAGSLDIAEQLNTLGYFEVVAVSPSSRLDTLSLLLDAGEANAIELAASRQLLLVIDELKGRQIAQQMGVNITGFAGLLVLAVRQRVLGSKQALDLLDRALADGMRLSDSLVEQVREQLKK